MPAPEGPTSATDCPGRAIKEIRSKATARAWERADRTYGAYAWSDATYAQHFQKAAYRQDGDAFDDYRPAYRYGTYARGEYADREWDDRLAADLERGWDRFRGGSKLTWERAKHAVADAFTLDRTRPH